MTAAARLILITDPRYSAERIVHVIEQTAGALAPGVLSVQLRDKTSPSAIVALHAGRLRDLTRRVGASLVINTIRPDVDEMLELATAIEADGVHTACTAHAIAAARCVASWVSVPVHTESELAVAQNADAALISPIFDTPEKGAARGAQALRNPFAHLSIYALGGITPSTAASCADAGARGVAVIRALLDADDPAEIARLLAAPFGE